MDRPVVGHGALWIGALLAIWSSFRPHGRATGSPDGVEVARRLAPVFAATRSTTLASIVLLDANGLLVAGPRQGASYARLPEVARALGGIPTAVLHRNGDYCAVYTFEWLSRAAAIRVRHIRPIGVGGQVVGVLLSLGTFAVQGVVREQRQDRDRRWGDLRAAGRAQQGALARDRAPYRCAGRGHSHGAVSS